MVRKIAKPLMPPNLNEQGAIALLMATFEFLQHNGISSKYIVSAAHDYQRNERYKSRTHQYSALQLAYEKMGTLMATWFSDPRFLDAYGNPLPLSKAKGAKSIASLIRASRTKIDISAAVSLMEKSPSIKTDTNGNVSALKRVFVLPELEVPRAAFVVERYLETLQRNKRAREGRKTLLLERSSHVSEVDLNVISPLVRDIESRGTAFLDSIDGEVEGQRLRRAGGKAVGEMGVLVFAWTKPSSRKTPKARIPLVRSSTR